MKRIAIYLRVSTADQTVENQRQALREAAERHGWQIVAEYADEGISGAKGRDKRPQFDAMLKAAVRREFDMIAAWSVDRLGRSLQDLVGFLTEIHGAGVDLYLHTQGLDTSTPAGRALFGMLSVFADFERALIVERTKAGLARAKASGVKLGRKPIPPITVNAVMATLGTGASLRSTAKRHGLGIGTVHRIKGEMAV